jgi:S-adenosylmethionine synthetase
MEKRILTAESVTNGHPDKLADLIADTILDACLEQDTESRVACEVLLSDANVFVVGELSSSADVNCDALVREIIEEVGYDTSDLTIKIAFHRQSSDISQAVSKKEQGAGDQGIVFGYATSETLSFLPLPIELAHRLTDRLTYCREEGIIKGLLPDGKSQVSVLYKNGRLDRITSVLVSAQHEEWKTLDELTKDIKAKVIDFVFRDYAIEKDTEIIINPSGRFVLGGFKADSGLTGRKLMVDSYGPEAHHGGGAYSGKDASKVDRSGAYMARYVAKNIVAAGLAEKCEVAISYAIGKAEPTSVDINTFYTGTISEELIKKAVMKVFDFRPARIIEALDLKQPVFAQTAVGGHFGKEYLMWEQLNKVNELKAAVAEG